jgi:hypothetical protein
MNSLQKGGTATRGVKHNPKHSAIDTANGCLVRVSCYNLAPTFKHISKRAPTYLLQEINFREAGWDGSSGSSNCRRCGIFRISTAAARADAVNSSTCVT